MCLNLLVDMSDRDRIFARFVQPTLHFDPLRSLLRPLGTSDQSEDHTLDALPRKGLLEPSFLPLLQLKRQKQRRQHMLQMRQQHLHQQQQQMQHSVLDECVWERARPFQGNNAGGAHGAGNHSDALPNNAEGGLIERQLFFDDADDDVDDHAMPLTNSLRHAEDADLQAMQSQEDYGDFADAPADMPYDMPYEDNYDDQGGVDGDAAALSPLQLLRMREARESAELARRVELALAAHAHDTHNSNHLDADALHNNHLHHMSSSDSYERLCKQYLDGFTRGAAAFARESQLSLRVSTWTQKLEPVLAQQESETPFDIHVYADQVLQRVQQLQVTEQEGPQQPQEEVVSFEQVAQGLSSKEVGRVFLACLQLANLGDVDVLPRPQKQTLGLKLLLRGDKTGGSGEADQQCRNSGQRAISNFRAPSVLRQQRQQQSDQVSSDADDDVEDEGVEEAVGRGRRKVVQASGTSQVNDENAHAEEEEEDSGMDSEDEYAMYTNSSKKQQGGKKRSNKGKKVASKGVLKPSNGNTTTTSNKMKKRVTINV